MELDEAITYRRSIRKYSQEGIPKQDIYEIIQAGVKAPTATNRQAWKFIIISDQEVKDKIVDNGGARFIKDAPVSILVLYSNKTDNVEWEDNIVSGSLAIQNMVLKAHEMKLGTCIVCHLPTRKQMQKLLKIPEQYTPIALLTLGQPAEERKPTEAKHDVIDLVEHNYFAADDFQFVADTVRLTMKRVSRKAYYRMPCRKYLKPVVDFFFEKKF